MRYLRSTSISFTSQEYKDLLLSWVLVSLAFAIVFAGGFSLSASFSLSFLISGITVGLGFILHELAHKLAAHHYGCSAVFKANKSMLVFALITSFFGFVFAAPGAVWIKGAISKKQNGIISAVGPATNIVLALVFFTLSPILGIFSSYGLWVNAYLALFNMLPFPGFDGSKVLTWNKIAFGALLILSGILTGLSYAAL